MRMDGGYRWRVNGVPGVRYALETKDLWQT
jgi:hypothetical protein